MSRFSVYTPTGRGPSLMGISTDHVGRVSLGTLVGVDHVDERWIARIARVTHRIRRIEPHRRRAGPQREPPHRILHAMDEAGHPFTRELHRHPAGIMLRTATRPVVRIHPRR